MKEVVDAILKAEQDAKQRIEAARTEAKKLVADAEVEARRLIETERDAAHDRARQTIDHAVADAKAERTSRLDATKASVADLQTAKADAMRRAVERATERIVRVEPEG